MTVNKYENLIDTSVRPQDDFFHYVNAKWLAQHPIPPSETRWGTFDVLRNKSWRAMRDLYQELQTAQPLAGSIEQQSRDFYYTGMHYDDFKQRHLSELRGIFETVDAIDSTTALSDNIGQLQSMGLGTPWIAYVDLDHDNSDLHVLHFYQSGLTLPSRDYYLTDSKKMASIRRDYKTHAHKVHQLLPELASDGDALWDAVMGFETAIAAISRPPADLLDVENNYHKTSFAALKSTYANIDWDVYAARFGWQADDKISIAQPEFMAFMNDNFVSRPLSDWKIYLKWRLAMYCFGLIGKEFSQLRFEFFGKILGGATKITPLWKRVVLAANNAIGEGSGRLYVERHFPESNKQQVLELVENVRDAYRERIEQLDWMAAKTKMHAIQKLNNMKVLIGYPDTWRDFSQLSIGRQSYMANYLAAQSYDVHYWLKRLQQPASRDDWFMTPQMVNAYNDPSRLVICFPAAVLQKPFFDPKAPLAANMGGIGTIIGHELTHGFDDQGYQFDAKGNVRIWQTAAERAAFNQKAQVIVKQANGFQVLPGLYLNGKLVLGESIADLGGVEIAFHALKKQCGNTLNQPASGRLTAAQLFFINFAVSECSHERDERLRESALTDPHPASEFRINGILRHVDGFYQTFAITKDDKLYLAQTQRAKIW